MALSSLTDLRIEVSVIKYLLVEYYQCLEKFADAVKNRQSLQRFHVHWTEGARPLQTARPIDNNWSPHVVSIDRERGLERNSEGKRGQKDWEEWECEGWGGPQSEPKSEDDLLLLSLPIALSDALSRLRSLQFFR